MLLLSVPVVTIAFLALVLPGVIWAWWCYPAPDGATRLSVGLALGLALQMFLLIVLGIGPGISRGSVALTTGALLLIAVLLAWRFHQPQHGRLIQWRRQDILFVLALVAILIPRLLPLIVDIVPQGWDPSFHSLLASTTVATGRLPNWAPYEPIALNYPYGSHLLIAAMSLLSGAAPDHVFAVFLNALVPLATCLALYAFTRRAFRRPEIALAAILAYGLLGNFGSLDYTRWGGLPNALGFFLFLAFLVVLFAPRFALYRVIVGGLLLGAIPLAHNHVMLTAVLLLIVYAVFLVVRSFGVSRHGSEVGRVGQATARRAFWHLALTSLVALFVAGFYVIPLLFRASQLRNTNVLRLIETVSGLPFESNGWILWGLAIIGMGLLYVPLFGYLRIRRIGRGGAHLARAFIAIALVTLALAFCLGYYGYREYSLIVHHHPYTAFTPSRFLTDMTYFLALYAGIGLMYLWNLGAKSLFASASSHKVANRRVGSLARIVVRTALVCLVVVTTGTLIWSQVFVGNRALPGQLASGEREAFTWIQTNTPKNALIINLDPNAPWAPYFTQREVAFTPVPTDEFTAGYVNNKRLLANDLLKMLQFPGSPPIVVPSTNTVFVSLVGRPVFILTDTALESPQAVLIQRIGAEFIYAVPEGFSLLQPPT